jgi:4-hydroxy-4-methyl-2-oxoglutarate aldolase
LAQTVAQKGLERSENEEAKRERLKAGELSLDIYDMRQALADAGLEYVDSVDETEE